MENIQQPEKSYKTKAEVEEIKARKSFTIRDWTIVQVEEDLYLVVYYPYKLLQARV